jgi:hypothetical protein
MNTAVSKVPKASVKQIRLAAPMPGRLSGRVTCRKALKLLAPRLFAASIRR